MWNGKGATDFPLPKVSFMIAVLMEGRQKVLELQKMASRKGVGGP